MSRGQNRTVSTPAMTSRKARQQMEQKMQREWRTQHEGRGWTSTSPTVRGHAAFGLGPEAASGIRSTVGRLFAIPRKECPQIGPRRLAGILIYSYFKAPADVSNPQLYNISTSPYLWEIIGVNVPFHTPFPLIKANVCYHK
eukprot:scaffold34220_cov146-Isochrysis_galbana.AAC.2